MFIFSLIVTAGAFLFGFYLIRRGGELIDAARANRNEDWRTIGILLAGGAIAGSGLGFCIAALGALV